MSTERKKQTENLVLGAILTAIVIVLQLLGGFIKFGPFSISLVLIPIVIGAAKCGVKIGTWLGFVFGAVVLLSGGATAFFAVNVFGTVLTVLLKGAACGFAAGLTYKLLAKYNKYAAARHAARDGEKSRKEGEKSTGDKDLLKEALRPKFGKSLGRSAVAQRLASSPKSAALRKTSKNNPLNKAKHAAARNKPKGE